MALAVPGSSMKPPALKTPKQVAAAEEVLADPFQSFMILRLRNASRGHQSVAGPQLIASVNEIAVQAAVEVTERQLRNRLRGMIRRGLIEGEEDGPVKLTVDGDAVAGALSTSFVP